MSQRHPVWVAENHVNPCNSVQSRTNSLVLQFITDRSISAGGFQVPYTPGPTASSSSSLRTDPSVQEVSRSQIHQCRRFPGTIHPRTNSLVLQFITDRSISAGGFQVPYSPGPTASSSSSIRTDPSVQEVSKYHHSRTNSLVLQFITVPLTSACSTCQREKV